jgi:GNAT superfamily N-acetyltransferase
MLVTHPGYRRWGAGSMLIQWGCDRADEEGVPAYVEAHQAAAPLYQKFGFRDRTDLDVDLHGAVPMVREPRAKN